MALVSTFEILLKPQLPKSITDTRQELAPLARTILQGYFLTIANLSDKFIYLSLVVTTRTPGLEKEKVLTTLDTTGVNGPVSSDFDTDGEVRKSRFSIPLNSNDTGLFILQPNALNADLVAEANYELRGTWKCSLVPYPLPPP